MKAYKPRNYHALLPYLIIDNALKLVNLLTTFSNTQALRRFEYESGKIAHFDWQLDDTVIMISNSTESYAANMTMLYLYVPEFFKTFDKAIESGCAIIKKPVEKQGDIDTRGAFLDCLGNYWEVSTENN